MDLKETTKLMHQYRDKYINLANKLLVIKEILENDEEDEKKA